MAEADMDRIHHERLLGYICDFDRERQGSCSLPGLRGVDSDFKVGLLPKVIPRGLGQFGWNGERFRTKIEGLLTGCKMPCEFTEYLFALRSCIGQRVH